MYIRRYDNYYSTNTSTQLCIMYNVNTCTHVQMSHETGSHHVDIYGACCIRVIPGQINTKNGATSQILAKLGEHIHYHKLLFDIKF